MRSTRTVRAHNMTQITAASTRRAGAEQGDADLEPSLKRASTPVWQGRGPTFAAAVALFTLIAALDYATGAELTLSFFYLAPIALATVRVGLWSGVALSGASAMSCMIVDVVGGRPFSRPFFLYWNGVILLAYFLTVTLVLAWLARAQAKLRDFAMTDPLTGLSNRRSFAQTVEHDCRRAARSGAPVSLLVFDLDGFKAINDAFGHSEGDQVLLAVASVLRGGRATDTPARLGGDEFAVFFPDTDGEAAGIAAGHLRRRLAERMAVRWSVEFSMGLATFTSAAQQPFEEMLKTADALMYEAKVAHSGGLRSVLLP